MPCPPAAGCRSDRPDPEAVHLLAHHIGALTDATAEQIGALQQRRADLTETGAAEMLPRHGFHRLPALQDLRQQVDHAPEALQLTHDTGVLVQRLSLPFDAWHKNITQALMLPLATRSISANWR